MRAYVIGVLGGLTVALVVPSYTMWVHRIAAQRRVQRDRLRSARNYGRDDVTRSCWRRLWGDRL